MFNIKTQYPLQFGQNIQHNAWQNNQVLEISQNKEYEKASPKIYQGISLQELKFQTEIAIEKEKKSTFELLQWLLEVDRRMAWHSWGFQSLWAYLVACGYSESSASERVQALRLLQRAPEVSAFVAEGKISLTNAAKISRFLRKETKEHQNKFTQSETLKIVTEAAGKTKRHLDELFEKVVLTKQPERAESFKQKPKLVEISKELNAKLEKMKNIRGHDLSNEYLLTLAVNFWLSKNSFQEKYNLALPTQGRQKKDLSENSPKNLTQPLDDFGQSKNQKTNQKVKKPRTRYISKNIRMQVFKRDNGQCVSCGSKVLLQFDHLLKFKDGGRNNATNLTLKCRNCNLAREQP